MTIGIQSTRKPQKRCSITIGIMYNFNDTRIYKEEFIGSKEH